MRAVSPCDKRDAMCGNSARGAVPVPPYLVCLLRGAPCSQCSLESSSVTCVGSSPYCPFRPPLVVAGGAVDVASGRDAQGDGRSSNRHSQRYGRPRTQGYASRHGNLDQHAAGVTRAVTGYTHHRL